MSPRPPHGLRNHALVVACLFLLIAIVPATRTASAQQDIGSLTIVLDFDPRSITDTFGPAHELSESNKEVFRAAAAYWESQITGYMDGVDRTITVRAGGVSGGLGGSEYYTNGRSLGALARAATSFSGPRQHVSSIVGGTIWVRLNAPPSETGPVDYLDGNPVFTSDEFKNTRQAIPQLTARHEMGHILMNSSAIRATGNRSRLFDAVDTRLYIGEHGLAAYRAESNADARFVPFDGTSYFHFPRSANVLLSASATRLRLGDTTLGVLRDLGFMTVALVNPEGDLLLPTPVTPTPTPVTPTPTPVTPPSVVISGVAISSSAAFTATFTFSQDVTGFDVGDITVGNGQASAFSEITPRRAFTALITPTDDGIVTIDIAANVATSTQGANNTAATQATTQFAAPACASSFDDVSPGQYFSDAVNWAFCSGVTTGTSPSTFSPTATVTRAQWATLLWRFAGEPTGFTHPFTDVVSPSYYEDAVAWMAATGVTTGVSATMFSPDAPITRAQLATFLWRYAGEPLGFSHQFVDVESPSYYADAAAWLAETGVTTGTSATTYSPHDPLTRAQAVTFLFRYNNQR